MLKIWGRATSVNVQKVMWTVGELDVAHERIDAGGAFGRNDTPEYRSMNPNGLVPVLDDNGFTLWESNAIVRYLASTYGRATLAPHDAQAFAKADQWMDWAATSLYYDIITVCFWGLIRTPATDRNVPAIEAAAKRAGERLALLDAHLANRAFIGGDALSMADIPVGSLMYRYFTMEIARPSLPNLEAWYGRLAARAPYQTHVMMDYSAMKVPGA